jgi:hypothetical protein
VSGTAEDGLSSRLADLSGLARPKRRECREHTQPLEDWSEDIDVVELVAVEAGKHTGYRADGKVRSVRLKRDDTRISWAGLWSYLLDCLLTFAGDI